MFFTFSLIIEGTAEKLLQFKMTVKSIYNKNFGFIEKKNVILNTTDGSNSMIIYLLTLFLS
jgi:hypothetical protein